MSITSQLPPIPLGQASADMRALAQAAGGTVEARVLGRSDNGTTQVQIGRQMLNLTLPMEVPVGATLSLSVQQTDGQLRLSLVAVRPPAAQPISPPLQNTPQPAASVQLSAAALSSPALANTANLSATTLPTAVVQPSTPAGSAAGAQDAKPIGALSAAYGGQPQQGTVARTPLGVPPGAGPSPGESPAQALSAGQVAASAKPPAATMLPASGSNGPSSTGNPPNNALTAPNATAVAGQPAASLPAGATGTASATPAPMAMPNLTAGLGNAAVPSTPATVSPAPPSTTQPLTSAVETVVPVSQGADVQGPRANIPPMVAAPASGAPAPTALTAAGRPGVAQVAQVAATGMAGQHAPPGDTGSQGMAANTAPASAPPTPATLRAALAQMVQQSLPRQDSILGLTAALTAVAGKVALPEPVAKAAQQVLSARLGLDGGKLSGAAIKTAVQQSGLFQEALLASGQERAAGSDLKSGLMALRQGLGAWLGNQAAVAKVSSVAPPQRGQVPRARVGDGAAVPDDPVEAGKHLLDRTEAALSRLRLHQNASLPDANPSRTDSQWSMDLPVVVAGQNNVLHMQIERDAEQEADRPEERGWQVRFAINLAERGEVGAHISLRARNTGVLLWADDERTARSLALAVEDLRQELADVGLVPGAIVIRAGAPADLPAQPSGQPQHYLDASR